MHERQYGFALPGEAVELINLRVTALRPEPPARFRGSARRRAAPTASAAGLVRRRAAGRLPDLPPRRARRPAHVLDGPAVIEEPDSTTLVFPATSSASSESGVLVLDDAAGRR